MLRFAEVEGGDIRLTDVGLQFARSETDERRKLFARHLITYVPLAAHIRRVLDERASHTAPKSRFFDELEDYMAQDAAEQTPSSAGGATRKSSPTTTIARRSVWKTRPLEGRARSVQKSGAALTT